jgi:hypothetical protein
MLIKEKRKNLEAGKVLMKILHFLKLPYSLDTVMLENDILFIFSWLYIDLTITQVLVLNGKMIGKH